jgi:HD-GYP domain-containing protein (c-di-GMP phosphodiesterase class II)
VIAVADSFDAMTSERPYRAGMTTSRAAQILRNGRGQQWEPAIVDAFLRYLEKTHAPVMTVGDAAVNEMAMSSV